jgi:hypothetical protein
MQLVSGIYLLIAVNKIRSFLVNRGMGNQVNYKAMYLHGISFSLYNLSIIVLYAVYAIFNFYSGYKVTRFCLIAWITTCYSSFVA